MKKKWSIIGGILVIVTIALAFFLSAQKSKAPDTKNLTNNSTVQSESVKKTTKSNYNLQISQNGKTVSYKGKTGKTALDILKSITDLETKDTSFGPQITGINGVKSTDKEYWLYTVNGQAGTKGAHQYQTKDGDKIEWKLTP